MMLSCKQLLRISTTLVVRIFSFQNKIKNNCNASRSELLDRWTLRTKEKLSKMSKGYQQSLNILGQDKKKTTLGFKLFYCLFYELLNIWSMKKSRIILETKGDNPEEPLRKCKNYKNNSASQIKQSNFYLSYVLYSLEYGLIFFSGYLLCRLAILYHLFLRIFFCSYSDL